MDNSIARNTVNEINEHDILNELSKLRAENSQLNTKINKINGEAEKKINEKEDKLKELNLQKMQLEKDLEYNKNLNDIYLIPYCNSTNIIISLNFSKIMVYGNSTTIYF